jgi:hypothetical protein
VAAEHSPRCQTNVSKAEQAKQPVVAKRLPGPLVAAHNNALESLAPPVHAADPRWWSTLKSGPPCDIVEPTTALTKSPTLAAHKGAVENAGSADAP